MTYLLWVWVVFVPSTHGAWMGVPHHHGPYRTLAECMAVKDAQPPDSSKKYICLRGDRIPQEDSALNDDTW